MTYATTWMNLEKIMLSEEARQKKSHITLFNLFVMSRIGKYIKIESRLLVARELGKGGMGKDC